MDKSQFMTVLTAGVILFSAPQVHSQTKDVIKASGSYYFGEAESANEQEAEDLALSRLVQNIAVTVSSSFEDTIFEGRNGGVEQSVQLVLQSYAGATLRDVKTLKEHAGGFVKVFRYIDKAEVQRIFNERLRLASDVYRNARQREEEGDPGYALKWYYFAMILLQSVPEQNVILDGMNLTTEIPHRINGLINGTRFRVTGDEKISEKEREITLEIMTNGVSAKTLEFSFWDGTSQVYVPGMDGRGVFTLLGASTAFKGLDIAVKYSYYESREELKEVADLWNVVRLPTFKNAIRLSLDGAHVSPTAGRGSLQAVSHDTCLVAPSIQREATAFVDLLRRNDTQGITARYASDPFLRDKILSLIRHNALRPTAGALRAEIHKTYTGWELRKIPVIAHYPTLKKQSVEYLVLDFRPDGQLEDVTAGITENLYDEFVRQSGYANDWEKRQVIMKFVERYRTAFLCRNIGMLDSLFAEDAVIIVGRILHRGTLTDVPKYNKTSDAQPDFQTMRYTKQEYLKNQAVVFRNQKDIALGFSTFGINRKNDQPGVYGISLRQNYASTSYADEGYLFLLVDFNASLPQIYVRAWQPREWNDDALVRLSNFKINR
jgi:hypothetical protein